MHCAAHSSSVMYAWAAEQTSDELQVLRRQYAPLCVNLCGTLKFEHRGSLEESCFFCASGDTDIIAVGKKGPDLERKR